MNEWMMNETFINENSRYMQKEHVWLVNEWVLLILWLWNTGETGDIYTYPLKSFWILNTNKYNKTFAEWTRTFWELNN